MDEEESQQKILNPGDKISLYLYAREDQFLSIIRDRAIRLSHPWATNDVTEGVMVGENEQAVELEKYGYVCLSENCTSPAMWGYYADSSRGVCFIFDFYVIRSYSGLYEMDGKRRYDGVWYEIDGNRCLYKVNYSEERETVNRSHSLLLLKSTDWKHEKEYRIIYSLRDADKCVVDGQPFFYSPDILNSLSGIILGCRCRIRPIVALEMIIPLVPRNNVCVKKARMSFDKFEMHIEEYNVNKVLNDDTWASRLVRNSGSSPSP